MVGKIKLSPRNNQNLFRIPHSHPVHTCFTIIASNVLSLNLKAGAAIDDYVNFDDGYFSWEEVYEYRFEGVTLYMANMTSQKWLNG